MHTWQMPPMLCCIQESCWGLKQQSEPLELLSLCERISANASIVRSVHTTMWKIIYQWILKRTPNSICQTRQGAWLNITDKRVLWLSKLAPLYLVITAKVVWVKLSGNWQHWDNKCEGGIHNCWKSCPNECLEHSINATHKQERLNYTSLLTLSVRTTKSSRESTLNLQKEITLMHNKMVWIVKQIDILTGPPPIAGTIVDTSMTVEPNITR